MTIKRSEPTLFQQAGTGNLPPLAERIRPASLDAFVGHKQLVGEGHLLKRALESGNLFSIIFWGPPGSGKTTLARVIANHTEATFVEISAVSSGVKEVRQVIERAAASLAIGKQTVLFIDEIHRFNKTQQDALLHASEDGTVILIGATTENPSFEVVSPLLSRCRVIRLEAYSIEHMGAMLDRAMNEDILMSRYKIALPDDVRTVLIEASGGDARKMFNTFEVAVNSHSGESEIALTKDDILEALQQRGLLYDRTGDYHYDTISALIKSLRGSDPDAAIYWLAVMLEGGEKPEFIARRLVIQASEDVGNADPQALQIATAGAQAVHMIGMPEAAIILAQVTTYLASAPKSNASYLAVKAARKHVMETGLQTVPLHLRNAATSMMKEMGYGRGYIYPHDEGEHFVKAHYFPDELKPTAYYRPTDQGHEEFIRQRLRKLWPERY